MEGVWGHSPIRADIVDVLFLLIFKYHLFE